MKKQLMLLTLCLVAVFVSVSAVSAADVYVNTTGDDTTGDGSAVLPFLTIAKGVTTAVSGDTVIIAPGTYTGAGNKNIDINKDITIQGAGENQTIIDLEGSGYAFEFESGTSAVKNLTVKKGNVGKGSAIFNMGTLALTGCTFTGNSADVDGGAVYNRGTLALTGCTFTGNSAVYFGGAIFNMGTLALTGCTFTGNSADVDGGAIYNNRILTLTGCTFTGNSADYGGGLYNIFNTLTVADSNFSGNSAIGGGAFFNWGFATVTGSNFHDNTAQYGGAIYNRPQSSVEGTLTVTGCNIVNNTAEQGGALFNWGPLTAHFNRIVANTATDLYDGSNAIHNAWSGVISGENNWWGSNADPKSIPNLIMATDSSEVNVVVNPWLTLSISADPNEIFNTQTSNVVVNLFIDSNTDNHSSDAAQYPSQIPMTFTTAWGSITQAVLNFGTGTAIFTANGGAIPAQNPVMVTVTDALNPSSTLSTTITIKSAADLYLKVTSSTSDPKVGETFTITYKLGNYGPDAAKNVTITLPLPAGFEVSNISGDGQWTYNKATNSITWTMADVPVGDPYLYVTGKLTSAGSFIFDGSIVSETFNLNTEGVTPVTVNAVAEPEVKAATKTVAMQTTGVPLAYLVLAVLLILGGLTVPKKK